MSFMSKTPLERAEQCCIDCNHAQSDYYGLACDVCIAAAIEAAELAEQERVLAMVEAHSGFTTMASLFRVIRARGKP